MVTLPLFLFKACGICFFPQRKVDSYLEKQASTSKFHRRFWPFGCPMKTWDAKIFGMDVYCLFSRNLCQHAWLLTLADSFAFHGCQNATSQGGIRMSGMVLFFAQTEPICLGLFGEYQLRFFCWIVKTKCKKMVKDSKTTTKRYGSHQKISNQFFLPFWRIGHFRRVLFFHEIPMAPWFPMPGLGNRVWSLAIFWCALVIPTRFNE